MKRFVLYAVLYGISVNATGQPGNQAGEQVKVPGKESRWDLDKYVWSHTHYKTGKDDKPVLDFDAIENWMQVGPDGDLSISGNGRYFAYGIQHSMNPGERDTLVVQSVSGSWRQTFSGVSPGFFTGDSKQYVFLDNDSLCFLDVEGKISRRVPEVVFYQLPAGGDNRWMAWQHKDNASSVVLKNLLTGMEKNYTEVSTYGFDKTGTWLTCQLKNETRDLVLYNLGTGKEYRFPWVESYVLDNRGEVMVFKTAAEMGAGKKTSLQYVSLSGKQAGKPSTMWTTGDTSKHVGSYSMDGSGSQVIFVLQAGHSDNSIWYYKKGMEQAVLKVNNQMAGIEAGLQIQGGAFTINDKNILIALQAPADQRKVVPSAGAKDVEVWSYRDKVLQTALATQTQIADVCMAVIPVQGDRVTQVVRKHEEWKLLLGDCAVVARRGFEAHGDRFWEEGYFRDSIWVVSYKDGKRKLMPLRYGLGYLWASPGGRYIVHFDPERGNNFYSYDPQTGEEVNISSGVPAGQLGYVSHYEYSKRTFSTPTVPFGRAAWLEGDKGMLVYDEYDIWLLDLSGKKPAVNITHGYGRRHLTILSLLNSDRFNGAAIPVLKESDTLLLKAFNRENKKNGFFRIVLNRSGDPEMLSMDPRFMISLRGIAVAGGMMPLKASGTETWIVRSETATDAPNYFLTRDFKTYTRLTDIQPQKKYNWLTTELHRFKQLDGAMSQGILYKPENFDSTRQYPVIISFYTQNSDPLYQFPVPEYLTCPSIFYNPAWFVNHGYLVFLPDIYFDLKKGWGPSTVNTMDGAAGYLSSLPYVDGKRIGASGHSNSGRFGYYLLTHSKSFAAMSIGSGSTDIISDALSITRPNALQPRSSFLKWAELDAVGTGLGNLWQNKELWLDHTAVLQADRVTSPLLLFHSEDDSVPIEQAMELFLSLWRLNKKVWWLRYPREGHFLVQLENQKDYTIRYTQFFDHYLKGAPAPEWMTGGGTQTNLPESGKH